MTAAASDIAFTPSVKAFQEKMGSRRGYARMEEFDGWKTHVNDYLKAFLAEQDTFFLGTVSSDGQPYIQHRGGPKGFLRKVDDQTLAFGDFEGNRQYITAGNLQDSGKAFIFLIDFPRQQRIKLWGRAEVVENDKDLLASFTEPDYGYEPTRAVRFHLDAWDANCPQHITPRFTKEQIDEHFVSPLQDRIRNLEKELEDLQQASA
jgi:predicted pyridoxine 5'-phosphate oxidase superfamily flavin-nucleotide-binding protein